MDHQIIVDKPAPTVGVTTLAENERVEAKVKKYVLAGAQSRPKTLNVPVIEDARVMTELIGIFRARQRDVELAGTGAAWDPFIPGDAADFLERIGKCLLALLRVPPPATPKPAEWTSPLTGRPLKNPWTPGSENLSDQAFLEKTEPDLAAALKREATGLTYRELAEMKHEAQLTKEAFEFTGKNPWVDDGRSMTERANEQAAISRVNKALAERLMTEAAGPGANPFSRRSWNITQQSAVLRADSDLARWMKLGRIHSDAQLDAEIEETKKAAAQAQFRKADADSARRQAARAA
jgi:hypothetical protein